LKVTHCYSWNNIYCINVEKLIATCAEIFRLILNLSSKFFIAYTDTSCTANWHVKMCEQYSTTCADNKVNVMLLFFQAQLGELLALEAEKALCNLLCFNTERLIRMKFIEGCLENLANNW
jgi:hypothetical protein